MLPPFRRRQRISSQPRPVVPFEDRLWPVLLALLALAAIGAACIVSLGEFRDPRFDARPWSNGWIWLGSLAALTLVAMLVVSRLDASRRGIQLAAILSMILHILLFLSLNDQQLIALAEVPLPQEPPEAIDDYRAPDYHIRAPEDPVAEFEKPVETPLPETEPPVPAQQEKQHLDKPLPLEPAPEDPVKPDVEPHVLPLEKPEQAAPQMADLASELSRAEASGAEPDQPDPVAVPEQELPAELDAPQPAEAEPDQSETELAPPEPELSNEPLAAVSPAVDVQAPLRVEAEQPEAVERLLPPASLAERVAGEVQLQAPQVADVPRAQLGVDEPLDEPQPLVKMPLRSGAGQRLPVEMGASLADARSSVAVGPVAPQVAQRAKTAEPGPPAPLAPSAATGVLRKSTATPAPVAAMPEVDVPRVASRGDASAAPGPLAPAASASRGKAETRLSVPLAAPQGVGGIATNITPRVGTPSRRMRQDDQVLPTESRLLARTSGGPLPIDGRTREPAEAFARRGGRMRSKGQAADKPSQQTEAAIELGLVYLSRQQAPDGSWNLHFAEPAAEGSQRPQFRAETAATGLALLAFLGAGYDHYGGQYADVVQRALDSLVRHQRPSGDLYQPEGSAANRSAWLYSHGIATLALCEAYGMTGDDALREPAQRAIEFIRSAQDPERGAWRYIPGNGSDTSVSGWQLMALKSGELAGLHVPEQTYEQVRRWLDRAQYGPARYVYNPAAPDTPTQRHGRQPTPAMTAVGFLMRLYTGLSRDDQHMVEGADFLLEHLPQTKSDTGPARDTYYWYYATQFMFHMRGKYWQAWNDRLHPLLVGSQVQQGDLVGSWDPLLPVPDRWGPQAGRIYVTTLNLLSLEVYYRHLPLYESTAQ